MLRHTVTAGLAFGDEGKGSVVDALCTSDPDVSAVIRANGGAQAAHSVVLPDGRHHTFSQFGSGHLRGVHTHLSRFMLVNPLNLAKEAESLRELTGEPVWDKLTIDWEALVTTPYHVGANRFRETQRGDGRHGSCGQGIGETQRIANEHPELAVRISDISDNPDLLLEKLTGLKALLEDELGTGFVTDPWTVATALRRALPISVVADRYLLRELLDLGPCVFEGAQGVLLDENWGFHPYTTWSTTTFQNAETLLAEAGRERSDWTRLGVLRSYGTRHGAGPFPTEDATLVKSELHNGHGEWQGAWRVGHLDLVLLRWSLKATGGIDELALTHLDQSAGVQICNSYLGGVEDISPWAVPGPENMEKATQLLLAMNRNHVGYLRPRGSDKLIDMLEGETGAPVTIASYGPTSKDKIIRERISA